MYNRIGLLRTRKKMSQKQLGAAVGLHANTICRLEASLIIPEDKLFLFADYFKVSPLYLLGYDVPKGGGLNELLEKIVDLKFYRHLRSGLDVYINEQDVLNAIKEFWK